MNISTYFTSEESLHSETAERLGIPNMPPADVQETIKETAIKLDNVRKFLNRPMIVSSWYRSPAVNAMLGSKPTSQHCKGEAVDFICPQYGTPLIVAKALAANIELLGIDQLIYEYTWVHVSFSKKPRHSVLTYNHSTKIYTKGV